MKAGLIFYTCVVLLFVASGCPKSPSQVVELKKFPVDSLDGIITRSGAQLDAEDSSDGKGSLRIIAEAPTVVRLFELSDIEIEDARLIYQARLRAKDLEGQAYIEMWCHFPGKGEFFSRGLQNTVSGTMQWITAETPFLLKKGEKPDIIKLNLVINGKGTVWIDDIRLLKGPLS
ncbi:MAG: hypothetical protein M1497_02815 [Nitrospirae bacterium]|nr:hypothetical protein [Nitrospirota bacterium]